MFSQYSESDALLFQFIAGILWNEEFFFVNVERSFLKIESTDKQLHKEGSVFEINET